MDERWRCQLLLLLTVVPVLKAQTTYKVSVFTGTPSGAGTDATVYITMYGELAESQKQTFDDELNDFENGGTDIFFLNSAYLGTLLWIHIEHDNTGSGPGWFLDKVIVEDTDNGGVYEFVCNRWLARDEDDAAISRVFYGKIPIMEARFENYPTTGYNVLFDDDDGTCLNLNDYWSYLPMTTIRLPASGNFLVNLTVGNSIELIAEKTTKVFVSRSGVYTGDYYGARELYFKCATLPNLSFSCQCTGACSVYIRVRFMSMAAAEGIVYSLCGIDIG